VPLKGLLSAKNQTTIQTHFADVFSARLEPISEKMRLKTAADFNLKPDEAGQLIEATRYVIAQALFHSRPPQELFPEAFHAKLRDLIAQIVTANMKAWRESTLSTQVSLPRLESMDWRVDIKGASDQASRMNVPTVLVELKLASSSSGPAQAVQFELSNETLRAVLDGLGKIRDQLNAVNNQAA